MIHLYCLAVQDGSYSDVVECWSVTQMAQVQSTVIRFFSPVTGNHYKCIICFHVEVREMKNIYLHSSNKLLFFQLISTDISSDFSMKTYDVGIH